MLLQEYSKLLFEGDFAMVDFLIGNVRYDRFLRGFAH
jgi:hypothetical protein